MNGDRLEDLVVAGQYINVFLNLEGETISEVQQSFRGPNVGTLDLADLNGDGAADAVLSNGLVVVLTATGGGRP